MGTGKQARVLYDYEAEEDNELALQEGQIIKNIDEIDDGWWSGVGPGGQEGMFPGMYEILQPELC